MPKIKYRDIRFGQRRLAVVAKANEIVEEYAAQGYDLTLRQLYYQFVSRGLIPNSQREYKKLGDVVNDARLAGLIDWNHITDRTRNLRSLASWDDPESIIDACASQFRLDLWDKQASRIEVWIEKDALTGVIEGVCDELRVPFFSCRGYTSQSEMWAASQRLLKWRRRGQLPVILHLGDHDPSGIDMSRDIVDRLEMFTGREVGFERLALNMPQIEQYQPPPNPAKSTDARYEGYLREHGEESWELDALEPQVIVDLIRDAVLARCNKDQWKIDVDEEEAHKRRLTEVSEQWGGVCDHLDGRCVDDER